jgi:ribonuclease P protein component
VPLSTVAAPRAANAWRYATDCGKSQSIETDAEHRPEVRVTGASVNGGYRFGKGYRLRKRPEFLQLGERGKRLFSRHFILVYDHGRHPESRLGVTVTKKIGPAVTRNRLKRICREYFRRHRDLLGAAYDIHIIARSAAAKAAHEELNGSLEALFSQIRQGSAGSGGQRSGRPVDH